MSTYAYWFFGETLRDGSPIPADGEWLSVKGPLILCKRGLHASEHPFDALRYAPGNNLALVEVAGDIVRGDDKLCASRRKIVARFDATAMLREFACAQALSVVHLWAAPAVVREYLETGNERMRAAAADAAAAYASAAADAAAADAADAAAADAAAAYASAAYAADADAAVAAAYAAAYAADAAAAYASAASAAVAAYASADAAAKQRQRDDFARRVSACLAAALLGNRP